MVEAGGIFAIIWLCLFLPTAGVGVVYFYIRRDKQPIKSRYPRLVVVSDIVLVLYTIALCMQRVFANDWPCLVTVISGYVGTIVLCNTYLVRCWKLYFNYHRTQERIKHKDDATLGENSIQRFSQYTSISFLTKLSLVVLVVLIIPCIILVATESDVRSGEGDTCDQAWGQIVLAVYVAFYILAFLWFALSLRQVVDGFRIKEELRLTGIVAAFAVVPWFVFNTALEDVNNDVFPFSTLVLLLTVQVALWASTFDPLYRSLYTPPQLQAAVPENIQTLSGLLSDPAGWESFKEFLTKEFSVENLLFYQAVEEFRENKRAAVAKQSESRAKSSSSSNARLLSVGDGDDSQQAGGLDEAHIALLGQAQAIYAKYIIPGAPFEVNLPGRIVNELKRRLKEEYGNMRSSRFRLLASELEEEAQRNDPKSIRMSSSRTTDLEAGKAVETIFDDAAKNVFHLMDTDSYQRYQTSDAYKDLLEHYEEEKHKQEVLKQQGFL